MRETSLPVVGGEVLPRSGVLVEPTHEPDATCRCALDKLLPSPQLCTTLLQCLLHVSWLSPTAPEAAYDRVLGPPGGTPHDTVSTSDHPLDNIIGGLTALTGMPS